MPPGSPKKESERTRSPRCKTCGKAIRVPQGWTAGPAIRRHYWTKHREVMLPKVGKAK